MTSVNCAVNKGDLPIEINWLLNDKLIDIKTRSDIYISQTSRRTSMLNIDSINADHAGEYTCIANNSAGTVEFRAHLTVNGIFELLFFLLFYLNFVFVVDFVLFMLIL